MLAQAAYHFDAVREILKEFYPDVRGKQAHDWAVKLTAKYFVIDDEESLRNELARGWRIDLEPFRAHMRWLRHTQPQLFVE